MPVVSEHVVPVDLGAICDPNAPDAVLISGDLCSTVLALRPHLDDPDRRNVVLVWRDAWSTSMSRPNDEAIAQHRLYDVGLSAVLWIGLVENSQPVRSLKDTSAGGSAGAPALVHHVLTLKECVVEVVATGVSIERHAGTTRASACDVAGR